MACGGPGLAGATARVRRYLVHLVSRMVVLLSGGKVGWARDTEWRCGTYSSRDGGLAPLRAVFWPVSLACRFRDPYGAAIRLAMFQADCRA